MTNPIVPVILSSSREPKNDRPMADANQGNYVFLAESMMLRLVRRSWLILSLLGCLAVPYAWTNPEWREQLPESFPSILGQWDERGSTVFADFDERRAPTPDTPLPLAGDVPIRLPPASERPEPTGPAVSDLTHVIRFDISPSWVMQNWARITTTEVHNPLQGMRVPLVTGTDEHDLAGALTYYFDTHNRLQRLQFRGYTGNPDPLVRVVREHFHLQSEGGAGSGLYVSRWNARPTSVLRVRQAGVVDIDSPRSRWEILLEINRPNLAYGISPEVSREVAHRIRWN